MQQVAQPWVILALSNSSFWVGLDSFAMNAPVWIFTLWGGTLADRHNRRKIIFLFQAVQLLCVAILFTLLVLGLLKVWMIVLISFLIGTTDALSMPSFQSIIPSLVSSKEIPRAVSLNSTQFNLSRILGPMIAGIVIAHFGAVACFGANAISYIPFFLSLYWISPKRGARFRAEPATAEQEFGNDNYLEIFRRLEVRTPLLTIFITSMLCSPLITFCPVLIKDIFHADAGEFGGALAAFGFGGLIGAAATFLPISSSFKLNKFSTTLAIFLGLIVVAVALNRSFIMLTALLLLAGAILTASNIAANSFLQETASNKVRGRVASLFQLALHGGLSIGGFATGLTSAYFGISTALAINGVLALALQSLVLWAQPKKPA